MKSTDIPVKFPIPWANSAGAGYVRTVPQASQISITNGAASLTDGYPPLTFLPTASGGVPPFGQDTNGILKQVTQWLRWAEAGAPVAWDSSFSSSIGGYPNGAIVASATTPQLWWLSTTDDNTTNPDSGGSGWTPWQLGIASRVATLSSSTTLIAANSGVYYNIIGGTTQTLPAPSAATGLGFGFFAVGGFTLSTPSGAIYSGGLNAPTVALATADWIFVQSDGVNYRIIACAPGLVGSVSHQFAVANASAPGNAVALGQFLTPQTTQSTHGVYIGSGFNQTLTLTGTAPSAGYVLAWANINPTLAAATGTVIATVLDIQGSTVSSDATVLSQSHFGVAHVASGANISVAYNVSATGAPNVNATFRLMYAFLPHT